MLRAHARSGGRAERDRRRHDGRARRRVRAGGLRRPGPGGAPRRHRGPLLLGRRPARPQRRRRAHRAPGASSGGCPRSRTGSCPCCSRPRCPWCARCAAGRPGSGSSSRSRPTSASLRPTRGSGHRSSTAASPPTAARRGCSRVGSARSGPGSCCSSAGCWRGARRPTGARSTARCRPSRWTARPTRSSTSLAKGPTVALGLTKELLHRSRDAGLEQQLAAEALALELSSRSPDFREGITAMREKRDPSFGGR